MANSSTVTTSPPNTIVLIHGFWVTPRSWEHWITHYEGRGFRVLAPAYPGFEVEVEALNADPSPIEKVTVPAIIEHLESVVGGLDAPPILIGHSAGGVFTQILLDHGFGAAGVAINSAPTEGVKVVPLSQIRAAFPVLKNPANRHKAVGLTAEQWQYAFTNTFSEEESLRLYERYHVPASGSIFWGSALANIHPGKDDNWVDYHNERARPAAVHLRQRGPPHAAQDPAVQRQALQGRGHRHRGQGVRRATPAPGPGGLGGDRRLRPRLGAQPRRIDPRGRAAGVTGVRVTHIGGPTTLIEVAGWRLLTDPTFDDPGRTYRFGWGTSSRKVAGPAVAAADVGPVDAVLLTHDHHADNLDDAGRAMLPSVPVVVTTSTGARRLGGGARGLQAWDSTRLEQNGRPPIDVTATPCRHGPPGSHAIVGDVIGFALRWDGQEHGVLWITGDTVLYDGVLQVADRLQVATALVHLGGVRFPISGPLRYTMTARDAVQLCSRLRPRTRHPDPLRGLVPLPRRSGRHRA